jgi:glycosyltransferase involved in cell wall biosynthesis
MALPAGNLQRERRRTLAFLAKHLGLLPYEALYDFRVFYHAARIERFGLDLIETYNIDLIHSHFAWPSGYGGMLASAAAAKPLIASFRGMDLLVNRAIDYGLRRNAHYEAALRLLLPRADRTTYVSDFMRREGVRLGASADRAVVIPKGVDLARFRQSSSSNKVHGPAETVVPTILTVAGLIRRKGVDNILRALSILSSECEFVFIVCGQGPELERLQELARQLGLEKRTKFMGQVSRAEIPRYFLTCDIFVLASTVEASGNVLLEAMASGRPVICTHSGGPAEYVPNGVAGYVVPVGDPEAMAHKIRLLLANPALRADLGRQARAHAEKEYGYKRMIGDILSLYQEIGRDPGTGGRN